MKKSTSTPEPNAQPPLDARSHTELFAQAMRSFSAGRFAEARDQFDRASSGPLSGVNESARSYGRMCLQRLEQQRPKAESPEEHYDLGVSLINAGRLTDARHHLELAVAARANAHFLYALALAEGLLHSLDAAAAHLRRALEADPALRSSVRSDPDFHPLLHVPQIREVLQRESQAD